MTSRQEGDKSFQMLLFAFIVAASMAASIIAVAFASADSYAVAKTMAVETPSLQNDQDKPSESSATDKPGSDFTEYIDRLLADADSPQLDNR